MKVERIAILGAGGFAQEVRWLIAEINRQEPRFDFLGYVVSDMDRLGPNDDRDSVLGDLDWLAAHQDGFEALALGIGTPEVRLELGRRLKRELPSVRWPSLVHPSVQMDFDSCTLEEGVLLCAGTIGTVNLRIGAFSMVNLACTIGHGAILGAGCVLNPTVNISGGVGLGEGVLVGTGAQILQYIQVGDGAQIGAGAVVTKEVEAGSTVVGIPARPKA